MQSHDLKTASLWCSRARVLLLFPVMLTTLACWTHETGEAGPPTKVAAVSQGTNTQGLNASPIRSVDFSNFPYPWVPSLGDPGITYKLQRGKFEGTNDDVPMDLFSVVYGDVTGDGEEEAIVALSVIVKGGSAAPYVIYIYTFKNGNLKLLWAFATGDRTHGGLRRVYAEDGVLVVELYGKDKVVGTELYEDDGSGAVIPYPFYYTRVTYKWDGSKFEQVAPAETLSDSKHYGAPIMPIFRQSD